MQSRPIPTAALAVLALAACAGADHARVPSPAGPGPVPPGSTEPLRFAEVNTHDMRRGAEVGRYVWGIDCAPPYDAIHWTTARGFAQRGPLEARFREALAASGFDVAGAGGGDLAPAADRRRARFAVHARIADATLELCRRKHWLTGAARGESGEASVRVDWSVYAEGDGRIVHRGSTAGTASTGEGAPQGAALLMEEAFSAAASALAGDTAFRAAVARGGAARLPTRPLVLSNPAARGAGDDGGPGDSADHDGGADDVADDDAPAAGAFAYAVPPSTPPDPADGPWHREGVLLVETLPRGTPARAQPAVEGGRAVVVGRIDGGSALLTLVPGAGPTLTVRPAPGVALDGVVERRDPQTGLALVRVPARLAALPLRRETPAVSDPVHALAANGTVRASGIVAGFGPGPETPHDLGRADLVGVPAVPGDPILDEGGGLVGIALAPARFGAPGDYGLTPFVPVGPALARMGVRVRPAGAETQD